MKKKKNNETNFFRIEISSKFLKEKPGYLLK